jgi:hypothetical protein
VLHEATRRYITSLSDQELVEYFEQGREAVEPAALAFAQEELHRRGVAPERLEALTVSARANVAMQETHAAEAAERSLSDRASTWAFVGGMFIFSIWPLLPFFMAWGGNACEGRVCKIQEMRAGALGGFISFWVILLLIVGGFSLIAWLFDVPGW